MTVGTGLEEGGEVRVGFMEEVTFCKVLKSPGFGTGRDGEKEMNLQDMT